MSTIKSSAENLTLNADGANNDIIFQSNGTTKATLDQAGLLTATSFAGSGANLTGLSTFNPDGAVTINESGADVDFRVESDTITNALFVDGAKGNVGMGVVPASDWVSGQTALQIGGTGSISSLTIVDDDQLHLNNNCKQTASSISTGWKYIRTDKASQHQQSDGTHTFKVAASGSADAAISWKTAMTIDNNGYVTKPYQPIATSAWSGAVTAGNIIPANRIKTNVGSHLAANGKFTAPVAGIYYYAFTGMANTNNNDFYVTIKKNGGTLGVDLAAYTNTPVYSRGTSFGYISLAVNDYLEFEVPGGHDNLHGNYGTINFALVA